MRNISALAVLFTLLAVSVAHAQESEPPPVPSGEGIVFGHAVFANGSSVSNAALVILASSKSSDTLYRLITDSSGGFILSLDNGKYEIDSLLDYYTTSGIDFASTASVNLPSDGNLTLIFHPAGSLTGKVSESGSPLPDASVSITCLSSPFDYQRINRAEQVKAGQAGDFLFSALPVGTCIVSSATDSLAGSLEVQILHGKTISAEVLLEQKATSIGVLPVLLAIIVVIIISIYFVSRKKKNELPDAIPPVPQQPVSKPKAQQRKPKEKQAGLAQRLADPKVKAVMSTLTDREKEIVRFLFKSNGRAKRSTIQNKLLIPKTSLLRNLRSLERKKIVKLIPFGRNIVAQVEDWLCK